MACRVGLSVRRSNCQTAKPGTRLHLVGALERLELPYLITGSIATIFWGEPRFTNDIDVVVQLPPEQVEAFLRAFPPPEFYVDEEAVRGAVARRGQFNVIHPASGLKVDVMVPTMDALDLSRFRRARRITPARRPTAKLPSPAPKGNGRGVPAVSRFAAGPRARGGDL
jgi:hypothetical protein